MRVFVARVATCLGGSPAGEHGTPRRRTETRLQRAKETFLSRRARAERRQEGAGGGGDAARQAATAQRGATPLNLQPPAAQRRAAALPFSSEERSLAVALGAGAIEFPRGWDGTDAAAGSGAASEAEAEETPGSDDASAEEAETPMTTGSCPSECVTLTLASTGVTVRIVRTAAQAEAAVDSVRSAGICGIDSEWAPRTRHPTALVQVATRETAFLFDMLALPKEAAACALGAILRDAAIVKVGFGLPGDITRLVATETSAVSQRTCLRDEIALSCNLVELEDMCAHVPDLAKRRLRGLGAVVRASIGCVLDKSCQTSAWEQRPLSSAQLSYAALDAVVLLLVHDKLQESLADEALASSLASDYQIVGKSDEVHCVPLLAGRVAPSPVASNCLTAPYPLLTAADGARFLKSRCRGEASEALRSTIKSVAFVARFTMRGRRADGSKETRQARVLVATRGSRRVVAGKLRRALKGALKGDVAIAEQAPLALDFVERLSGGLPTPAFRDVRSATRSECVSMFNFAPGCIPPFLALTDREAASQLPPLLVFVDSAVALDDFSQAFCTAGPPRYLVSIAAGDLAQACQAVEADVCEDMDAEALESLIGDVDTAPPRARGGAGGHAQISRGADWMLGNVARLLNAVTINSDAHVEMWRLHFASQPAVSPMRLIVERFEYGTYALLVHTTGNLAQRVLVALVEKPQSTGSVPSVLASEMDDVDVLYCEEVAALWAKSMAGRAGAEWTVGEALGIVGALARASNKYIQQQLVQTASQSAWSGDTDQAPSYSDWLRDDSRIEHESARRRVCLGLSFAVLVLICRGLNAAVSATPACMRYDASYVNCAERLAAQLRVPLHACLRSVRTGADVVRLAADHAGHSVGAVAPLFPRMRRFQRQFLKDWAKVVDEVAKSAT